MFQTLFSSFIINLKFIFKDAHLCRMSLLMATGILWKVWMIPTQKLTTITTSTSSLKKENRILHLFTCYTGMIQLISLSSKYRQTRIMMAGRVSKMLTKLRWIQLKHSVECCPNKKCRICGRNILRNLNWNQIRRLVKSSHSQDMIEESFHL